MEDRELPANLTEWQKIKIKNWWEQESKMKSWFLNVEGLDK